jgi:YVTN family beta-propeller protein
MTNGLGTFEEVTVFIIRICAVTLTASLSCLSAFAQTHVVAVSGSDQLALHNLATGEELVRFDTPRESRDFVALPSGIALSNHTAGNSVLPIDLRRRIEIGRLPSSSLGGVRPVHMYLTPAIDGKQYAVVLNDGVAGNTKKGERPTDSTLLLIDVVEGSPSFLKPVGETRLGRGHHKAGLSMKRPRLAVSNILDCSDVISVYDYGDPSAIKLVKSFSAADLGYNGSTFPKSCDETGKSGLTLEPHGTGTSGASNRVYHFLTGTGEIAIFDIDADVPTFKLLNTSGTGGASVKDIPGGRFMVVAQHGPREVHQKGDGAVCQIGQLVVIDAIVEKVAAQVPVFYGEPACRTSLSGKPQEWAAPLYVIPSPDGKTLFVEIGTLHETPPNAEAEARFTAVFDVSDPYRPLQLPSIAVGAGDDTRDHALTGDGKLLVVPNRLDNSVSVIDVAARQVVRTFSTVAKPHRVATFGEGIGPSKPVGPATLTVK